MMSNYTALFEPYVFNNGVEVKNRLVVAPMTHFGSQEDGSLSDQERQFLQHRAEDFGIFITAATLVSPEGKAFAGQPTAINAQDLPSLKERAKLLQDQGAKAVLQIHHGGKLAVADLLQGAEKVAPSADAASGARALSEQEVEKLVQAFANAAQLALDAGFDGVEIHGANGYLIQQFLSRQSNQRKDCWGEPLAFPLAVVDAVLAVREKAQRPDFIVGYRFSPEEPGENGLTMADCFALIDALVEKNLQYLHVSLWDFYKKARRGADSNAYRMQLIHQRIGGKLPLIGVGSLFSADDVLKAYQTGWAEFIAVGKAVMMNPNFATLIQNGQSEQIATRLDLSRADHYAMPDLLWQLCQGKQAWTPPVDESWQAVDI